MDFTLDIREQIARARGDLRVGVPIILVSTEGAVLVHAVETLSSDRLDAARTLPGATQIALTARRAETLKIPAYDGDLVRLVLPSGEGLNWIQSLADPADDLASPMKGPFKAVRDGDAGLHRLALRLAKDARLLPAVLVTEITLSDKLSMLTHLQASAVDTALGQSAHYLDVVHARLPLHASENSRLHVFRPDNGGEEHYAIEIGRINRDAPVLTRLHSACVTGDILGSLKCDCGPQLRAAMAHMGREGGGVLLYLNQEGRGIGLANKMRAYSLQNQGFDTVEANHRLGFEDDERDFRIGSAILKKLGINSVRLLTNNPAKIAMMEKTGITVAERVPLKVGENPFNSKYLETKASKSGHLL